MSGVIYLVGVIASIYLISTSAPGSLWFVWGVVFAVVNGALLIVRSES